MDARLRRFLAGRIKPNLPSSFCRGENMFSIIQARMGKPPSAHSLIEWSMESGVSVRVRSFWGRQAGPERFAGHCQTRRCLRRLGGRNRTDARARVAWLAQIGPGAVHGPSLQASLDLLLFMNSLATDVSSCNRAPSHPLCFSLPACCAQYLSGRPGQPSGYCGTSAWSDRFVDCA